MSVRTRQSIDTVSSSINAMLSILNGVTPLSIAKTNDGFSANLNVTLNPFQFVMSLLERVVGYDRVVEFLTEIATYGLPVLEDGLKIALISSLKDLFSCSVNPVIGEKLINEGVVLDLTTIDLLNVLNRCPLGIENENFKLNGSFFYFDVDRFSIPDQLERCRDLNAVMWYVKHRAADRTVWYGYDYQDEEHETLSLQNGSAPGTLPSQKDGVITMEYSEFASGIKDSMGGDMPIQVPHGNCLHVFLGNTKGIAPQNPPSYDDILGKTEDFNNLQNSLEEIKTHLNDVMAHSNEISVQTIARNELIVVNTMLNALNISKPIVEVFPNLPIDSVTERRFVTIDEYTVYMSEYTYTHTKHDLGEENKQYKANLSEYANQCQYRTPQENYYYHKTLFEFNTDYVMSVKFFDAKVVAAQIINILTGCFDMSLNISFEERLIRNEVERMLQKIIENDETATVSDCFFTFSNDEYDLLVDKTEKERIGRYTGDEYAYGAPIDYEKIYEELDKISSSATLSEQVTAFSRAINEISRTIKPEEYELTDRFSLDFSFLSNLLRSLTLSMVYSVISPKIYVLMAINLKVMGREPNFDVTGFIEYFKTMLLGLIKSITDAILKQITDWLLSLVKDLVRRLADRILLEQAEYYIRLLMSCMRRFRLLLGNEDWNMADVDYADIVSTAENGYAGSMSSVINTNC
jgi:hypothetical protein